MKQVKHRASLTQTQVIITIITPCLPLHVISRGLLFTHTFCPYPQPFHSGILRTGHKERRRKNIRTVHPVNCYKMVFQRLPQHFQGRAGKFREFIQKQHAVMAQRHLRLHLNTDTINEIDYFIFKNATRGLHTGTCTVDFNSNISLKFYSTIGRVPIRITILIQKATTRVLSWLWLYKLNVSGYKQVVRFRTIHT